MAQRLADLRREVEQLHDEVATEQTEQGQAVVLRVNLDGGVS